MQLVAYGAQDAFISGNPEITFFKVVYRRHTNFAIESIEQTYLQHYGLKSNQLQLLGYAVGKLLVFLFDEKTLAMLLSFHQNTVASEYIIYLQHRQIAGNPLEPLILRIFGNMYLAKKKLGYSDNSKDWAISSQALKIY